MTYDAIAVIRLLEIEGMILEAFRCLIGIAEPSQVVTGTASDHGRTCQIDFSIRSITVTYCAVADILRKFYSGIIM